MKNASEISTSCGEREKRRRGDWRINKERRGGGGETAMYDSTEGAVSSSSI